MQDFLERMINEMKDLEKFRDDLIVKYRKLGDFVWGDEDEKFYSLTYAEKQLLKIQYDIMGNVIMETGKYVEILQSRISLYTDFNKENK